MALNFGRRGGGTGGGEDPYCDYDCSDNYCCAGDPSCLIYWDCGCCGNCADNPICNWNMGYDNCGICGGWECHLDTWCGNPDGCCPCDNCETGLPGDCHGVPGCECDDCPPCSCLNFYCAPGTHCVCFGGDEHCVTSGGYVKPGMRRWPEGQGPPVR